MPTKEQTEFAHRWADALESGEYEQGFARIFDGVRYCCLGVALRIIDGEHQTRRAYLTEGETKTIGLRDHAGKLVGARVNGQFRTLAYANDKGVTFSEIAAFIREHAEDDVIFAPSEEPQAMEGK